MKIACREILFLGKKDINLIAKNPNKLIMFCGKMEIFSVVIAADTDKEEFKQSEAYLVVKNTLKVKERLIIYLKKTSKNK